MIVKLLYYALLLSFIANIKLVSAAVNATCKENCCAHLAKRPAQTFTFYQNTGRFTGGRGSYAINTKTYAGKGNGYLNPAYQCERRVGPPPANTYKLAWCTNIMHKTKTRPCSFFMEPQNSKKMCGRSEFFIHGCGVCSKGDSTEPPVGGCSEGCIIMNHENRKKLRVGDIINVVAKDPKTQRYPRLPQLAMPQQLDNQPENEFLDEDQQFNEQYEQIQNYENGQDEISFNQNYDQEEERQGEEGEEQYQSEQQQGEQLIQQQQFQQEFQEYP